MRNFAGHFRQKRLQKTTKHLVGFIEATEIAGVRHLAHSIRSASRFQPSDEGGEERPIYFAISILASHPITIARAFATKLLRW